MTDILPVHRWKPSSIKRALVGQVVMGAPSISGIQQVLRTDGGGLWRITYSGISLRGPHAIQDWQAWEGYLAGGATLVNAPMAAVAFAPLVSRRSGLASPVVVRVPDSDPDPAFPSQGPYGAVNQTVIASIAAAALRATTVTLSVQKGGAVRSGSFFGITHASGVNRSYRIVRVLSSNGMVTIEPPLREAVSAGTPIDFEWPSFLGRMIPDQDISPDIAVRNGSVTISFVEAFQ